VKEAHKSLERLKGDNPNFETVLLKEYSSIEVNNRMKKIGVYYLYNDKHFFNHQKTRMGTPKGIPIMVSDAGIHTMSKLKGKISNSMSMNQPEVLRGGITMSKVITQPERVPRKTKATDVEYSEEETQHSRNTRDSNGVFTVKKAPTYSHCDSQTSRHPDAYNMKIEKILANTEDLTLLDSDDDIFVRRTSPAAKGSHKSIASSDIMTSFDMDEATL